jgi:hypothetical protein
MLVVIAVIGVLIALLLPAIQAARESARRSTCASNLRQVGLAIQNFENGRGYFPPSYFGTGDWSVLALITPYLEQNALFEKMDFNKPYDQIFVNGKQLSAHRVPIYQCPSEVRPQLRINGSRSFVPNNYGVNMGTWLVWDPAANNGKGAGGDGVFAPLRGTNANLIGDGLSNTLCAAEVRTYTNYYRNSGTPNPVTIPATPADLCVLATGEFKDTGHTEWTDGRVHHIGFTTVFAPNTNVQCNGKTNVDYNSWQERKVPNPSNHKSYAAITARSHHPGLVQTVMMEGSVHPVMNDIDLNVWRALSTRNGGESAALPSF